jgi:hypothetical protein
MRSSCETGIPRVSSISKGQNCCRFLALPLPRMRFRQTYALSVISHVYRGVSPKVTVIVVVAST